LYVAVQVVSRHAIVASSRKHGDGAVAVDDSLCLVLIYKSEALTNETTFFGNSNGGLKRVIRKAQS